VAVCTKGCGGELLAEMALRGPGWPHGLLSQANEAYGLGVRRDRRHLGSVTLEWAAQEGRVLLEHDISTMTAHACIRVSSDLLMPWVFAASQLAPINQVIEDLL